MSSESAPEASTAAGAAPCRRLLQPRVLLGVAMVVAALLGAPTELWAMDLSATEVSSTELVEHPREWDGRAVVLQGEVVGERMRRGSMAWLHVNDDAYSERNIEEGAKLGGYNSGHAVWVPDRLAARVTFFGDYRHQGDIVRVVGTFNRACLEHGGDMDIHADGLAVLEPGHVVPHRLDRGRVVVALALLAAAAAIWVLKRRAALRRI